MRAWIDAHVETREAVAEFLQRCRGSASLPRFRWLQLASATAERCICINGRIIHNCEIKAKQ